MKSALAIILVSAVIGTVGHTVILIRFGDDPFADVYHFINAVYLGTPIGMIGGMCCCLLLSAVTKRPKENVVQVVALFSIVNIGCLAGWGLFIEAPLAIFLDVVLSFDNIAIGRTFLGLLGNVVAFACLKRRRITRS